MRNALPPAAFVDPGGANREAVDALFRRVWDLLSARLAGAAARPPMPAATAAPAAAVPDDPVPEEHILAALETLMDGAMNPANPGYIGHMDSMPAAISVVGAMVSAGLNNNMLSLEMAPAFSRLEVALLEHLAGLFGLPAGAGGVMTGGGTLANLHALAVARNRAFDIGRRGIHGLDRKPVLFASEAAHASLAKSAMVLGLGSDAVISVAADGGSRMRPDALSGAIDRAVADGLAPFAVVATAGTTVTGSIDPLAAVAAIAKDCDLWLHVDAAHGGALVFSDSERHRLAGIADADSITFNPQKWLYVAKTCAMVLFRDVTVLDGGFRIAAPYMADTGGFTNLGEIGIQGTRHADVLKLWLTLQHLGRRGIAGLVEEGLARTRLLADEIAGRPFLTLAGAPDSNLVCFRWAGTDAAASDDATVRLQAHLLEAAGIFLSLPLYRGRRWLRAVLLNPHADDAVMARLLAAVDSFAP